MKRGCVIGYDINEKGCQISYYDDSMEEPDTMMASSNNYLIPLVLGYFKDRWVFGKEAKRLAVVGEDCTETDLYGNRKHEMPELLSQDEGAFTAGVQEAGEQTQQDRRADKRHKENGRGKIFYKFGKN